MTYETSREHASCVSSEKPTNAFTAYATTSQLPSDATIVDHATMNGKRERKSRGKCLSVDVKEFDVDLGLRGVAALAARIGEHQNKRAALAQRTSRDTRTLCFAMLRRRLGYV